MENNTKVATTRTTAVVEKPKGRGAIMTELLETHKVSLQQALPSHMTIVSFLKTVSTACRNDPKLMLCTTDSFLSAVMVCAMTGLEPNTPAGEIYLIPYNREVKAIPGYKGLIKLAIQSGDVASITSGAVYANDHFKVEYGLNPKLEHTPLLDGERGAFRLVYAIGRMKAPGSEPVVEVMTKEQVDRIRDGSAGKNLDPWTKHYDEMARKTAVRRIVKYLPLSSKRFNQALQADNEAEGREVLDADAIVMPDDSTVDALADELDQRNDNGNGENKFKTLLEFKREELEKQVLEELQSAFPDDGIEAGKFLDQCHDLGILGDPEYVSKKNNKGHLAKLIVALWDRKKQGSLELNK